MKKKHEIGNPHISAAAFNGMYKSAAAFSGLHKSVAAFRILVESLIELSELGDDECDLFEKEWREAHKDVKKL